MQGERLEDTLTNLEAQIRKNPADPKLRVYLFQLLSVMGRWEKALTQVRVAADLDPKNLLMAQVCQMALQCEAFREQVFSGDRTPLVLGEPQEWISLLVQANHLFAKGRYKASQELTGRAFEMAPATPGAIDGKPFEWIADADSRFGPVLEAIIDGKYYWVPFFRIREVAIASPVDLRDVVWLPADFAWDNGGTSAGFIPARYPGSHESADDSVRMARKTDWIKLEKDVYQGMGQRQLVTDDGEYALLDVRRITVGGPKSDRPSAEARDV